MTNELLDKANWYKPLKTPDSVKAVLLENIIGGVGAFGLAGLGAYWASGGNWWTVLASGLTMGIGVGCGLMVARSSIDEIVDWHDYRVMIADMEATEDENDTLRQRIAALEKDLNLERLRADVVAVGRPARSQVAMAPQPDPTTRDAEALLHRMFGNQPWSKDAMGKNSGWTTTRWFAARDLLQQRGIIVTGNRKSEAAVATLADALTRLDPGRLVGDQTSHLHDQPTTNATAGR